ncbi:inositol-trisphosphate 3-kinase B-like isoform X2 [Varanus komodoensis]|uniref:inositol-trisphosphate 3-kinase B-like isoform X2 n=1 Tax=Varanus komodoensis TaxID=61221 RepID=UPI001CF7B805|nr:inositol-trisphosphate 3-kinase B-like isoform X2 [Varanus komodoensis]
MKVGKQSSDLQGAGGEPGGGWVLFEPWRGRSGSSIWNRMASENVQSAFPSAEPSRASASQSFWSFAGPWAGHFPGAPNFPCQPGGAPGKAAPRSSREASRGSLAGCRPSTGAQAAQPGKRGPLSSRKKACWRRAAFLPARFQVSQVFPAPRLLPGNFRPSEGDKILKKFSAVEDACLSRLMTDALRPFVPTYHGVVKKDGERYIQMDDLLRGLDRPSIMDCKMGTRTYLEEELSKPPQWPAARRDLYQKMVKVDPQAPTAQEHQLGAVTKARYMQWREATSSSATLGFRIEGITVEGGMVQRDFKQVRSQEQIVGLLLTFTRSRPDVLSSYMARLESMRSALQESAFFKTHEDGPRNTLCPPLGR